jgi:hypothetical protein
MALVSEAMHPDLYPACRSVVGSVTRSTPGNHAIAALRLDLLT